jgi:hypothetical protein
MTWVLIRQVVVTLPGGQRKVSSYGMLSRPLPPEGLPLIIGVSTSTSQQRSFVFSMTRSLCLFSSVVWLRHLQVSAANQNVPSVPPIRPR